MPVQPPCRKEDAIEKLPVTPSRGVPFREQLGYVPLDETTIRQPQVFWQWKSQTGWPPEHRQTHRATNTIAFLQYTRGWFGITLARRC
jgi:hypothetical protein